MNSFEQSRTIVCMGSINMDLVMFVDKLPQPGETVVTDNFSTFPGGKGGNQASTIGTLGGNAIFLGKLGGDQFSASLKSSLIDRGVEVAHILRNDGTAGIAIILVDKYGQNSIAFTPGSNALLTADEIYENCELFQPGRILLATFEIGVDLVYAAAKLAKSRGMMVAVDPAPMPNSLPHGFAKCVDVITPNESEATLLTGVSVEDKQTAEEALTRMVEMGFKSPIITLGAQGVVFYNNGKIHHIKPLEVKSVDSTAAGDVFAGALAVALAGGKELSNAVEFANIAAALSTTVKGAQTSIPSLELVRQHLRG